MIRGRLVLSFLLFIALCASIAYWGMQLYDPPLRSVAAPAQTQTPTPRLEAAAAVFGGKATAEAATNFQLRGVIFSGTPHDSVAIIAIEGKPPQAFRVNTEVVPGVKVQEVHRQYVLLSEEGTMKRVELPAAAREGQINGVARAAPLGAPNRPNAPSPPEQTAQPQQDAPRAAPAQGTTVVTQQEEPASQEPAPQANDAAQTEGADSSASSSDAAAGEEGAGEPADAVDPAQTQANPPRRQ